MNKNDKVWIEFILQEEKPKTKVYGVWSKCSECFIGTIKWHPQWRHYCFFPDEETIYSDRCLLNISKFVSKLNEEHKGR